MNRQPVVAGQFYPGNEAALKDKVAGYLQGERDSQKTLLAMVPHAGYIFSGKVAGRTLARANLASRVVLLGPNHTGRGAKISVWPDGSWIIPGGEIKVDQELSSVLLGIDGFTADYDAHAGEHSLEVILPFLSVIRADFSMVPVAVSQTDLNNLLAAGKAIAHAVRQKDLEVSIVVSTDMSHYISHENASKVDAKALEQILELNPEGLYETVRANNISMCGVLPMVMGMACVKELGAKKAELVSYATSGEVNQDYSQVVGYAGMIIS